MVSVNGGREGGRGKKGGCGKSVEKSASLERVAASRSTKCPPTKPNIAAAAAVHDSAAATIHHVIVQSTSVIRCRLAGSFDSVAQEKINTNQFESTFTEFPVDTFCVTLRWLTGWCIFLRFTLDAITARTTNGAPCSTSKQRKSWID